MKKILKPTFILAFFVFAIIISIVSCKEDTNCTVQIYVKTFADTNIVVPGAWVSVKSNHANYQPIGDSGYTDGNGMYSHIFPLEAIMDVMVTDNSTTTPRHGQGTIRLVSGKTVKATVTVN